MRNIIYVHNTENGLQERQPHLSRTLYLIQSFNYSDDGVEF